MLSVGPRRCMVARAEEEEALLAPSVSGSPTMARLKVTKRLLAGGVDVDYFRLIKNTTLTMPIQMTITMEKMDVIIFDVVSQSSFV